MVVIFGWGSGDAKDQGEIAPTTCPQCRNQVFLHHLRSEKRISLYFIPLVPYGSNEYLACPICRHGLELKPEHRSAVVSMRQATSLYRRGGLPLDAYQAKVDRFWRTIGVAPSGQQVLAPSQSIPPPAIATEPAAAEPSMADQLRDLGQLHADGILTDEEFASAKRRLLGG